MINEKDEPHLYTSRTDYGNMAVIRYSGMPDVIRECDWRDEPLPNIFKTDALCFLSDIVKVLVKSSTIIFYVSNGVRYTIPHTPHTLKECRQITNDYSHLMKIS